MSRVRWGNVAQLAALVVAAALIAFGTPDGCGSEPESIPLDALPGVGPVTAAAIIAWRDANGSFASVDQLADVDGIGPARLEKLRAQVQV